MRDLGDFQTPPALVAAVLDALGPLALRWPRVLEPTCGRGHFLTAVLDRPNPPRQVIGIEVQEAHAEAARAAVRGRGGVIRASLFDVDLGRDLVWDVDGPLLVVGNPPWVTTATLGALASANRPPKRNVKGAAGLEARTGSANFDIAEAVWLKLMEELAPLRPTIALLCKTGVARAVLAHARDRALSIADASIHRIDTARWFGAAAAGCLLRVDLEPGAAVTRVPVYSALGAAAPESILHLSARGAIADGRRYEACAFADGQSPIAWRQGIKHDAADVMELVRNSGGPWRNRLGEAVDIEPDFVYPLLKGRDVSRGDDPAGARGVIVTQRCLSDDAQRLAHDAPRLWRYLRRHAVRFDRRKSSIYRGRPPFAVFGVGPYSFAPYKVAVSGLHKTPRFWLYGPEAGRPRLCDDTCYFLPFQSPRPAALVAALLDEPAARDLVAALFFADAKRPVTKRLLGRIDLRAVLDRADRPALLARADRALARLGETPDDWPQRLDLLLDEPPAPVAGHCS